MRLVANHYPSMTPSFSAKMFRYEDRSLRSLMFTVGRFVIGLVG